VLERTPKTARLSTSFERRGEQMASEWRVRMGILVLWIVFWGASIMLLSKHAVWENPIPWLTVALVPALTIWALSSFVYGAVGGVLAGL